MASDFSNADKGSRKVKIHLAKNNDNQNFDIRFLLPQFRIGRYLYAQSKRVEQQVKLKSKKTNIILRREKKAFYCHQ